MRNKKKSAFNSSSMSECINKSEWVKQRNLLASMKKVSRLRGYKRSNTWNENECAVKANMLTSCTRHLLLISNVFFWNFNCYFKRLDQVKLWTNILACKSKSSWQIILKFSNTSMIFPKIDNCSAFLKDRNLEILSWKFTKEIDSFSFY